MATLTTAYTGELRTTVTHINSGSTLITDAPLDNQGKGESFSPTDLLAAALGSCMLTIMGITARNHSFSIDGARVETTKVMGSEPRRVSEIVIEITFPKNDFTTKQKKLLEISASTCPVAFSLHPDLRQTVRLNF